MVGAGGAIINYLFPGAREAPESKGAENIVSMEDIRLEQGLHEECGVFGIYDPEGSCAQTTYYGLYAPSTGGRRPAASRPSMTGSSPFIRTWDWSARSSTGRPFSA